MISITKLKILKILNRNPSYGLEIGKKLNITVSSIYKHLNYLMDENYIEVKEIRSKKERYKKIYGLTEKGKKLLEVLVP